jgi:Leucine-rich repeat (LRR) protein
VGKKRQNFVNVVCERPLTHKLIHSQLQSSTFGKIPTLLNINLNHNRLKQVKRGAFGGLFSLRSINLENNQLVEIPKPSISMTHLHLGFGFCVLILLSVLTDFFLTRESDTKITKAKS